MRIIQKIAVMLCAGLFAAGAAFTANAATPMEAVGASGIDQFEQVGFVCKLTSHGLICGSTGGGSQQKCGKWNNWCGNGKMQSSGGKGQVAAKSIPCPGAVVGTTVCATCPTGSIAVAMTCNFCPSGTTFANDAFHCKRQK